MINSGDVAWVLTATALVLIMTLPGLALFYGGLVRRKNVLSMIMMSFSVLCLISIQWILYGYSLAFGTDIGSFIGNLDFIGLENINYATPSSYAPTIPHLLFIAFQMMFAIITPALISGAVAERMKFSAYLLFILLWATFVYDPIAHWVWANGGWLKNLGVLDFAGGSVVHISSGISALVCAIVLGKRKMYGQKIRPHNLTLTLIGASLLWFGWFGFNGGSALKANETAVMAFVVTNTAAAAAGLTWMLLDLKAFGKSTILGGLTGAVSGLVAITPACGYVGPFSAILIGIIASIGCYQAITWIKSKYAYDDSLDVFGVHGVGGIIGALLTGIFADLAINSEGANGLIFGNPLQFIIQLIGVVAVVIYAAGMSYILLKIVEKFVSLRVDENDELVGLDLSQHEESAYTLID